MCLKIFSWFLLATIFQGLLLLLLLYSNIVLLIYHRPTSERPFDTMLIHAPLRFFLVLQIMLMFPLSLLYVLFTLPELCAVTDEHHDTSPLTVYSWD